jgi:hypothetical protein
LGNNVLRLFPGFDLDVAQLVFTVAHLDDDGVVGDLQFCVGDRVLGKVVWVSERHFRLCAPLGRHCDRHPERVEPQAVKRRPKNASLMLLHPRAALMLFWGQKTKE